MATHEERRITHSRALCMIAAPRQPGRAVRWVLLIIAAIATPGHGADWRTTLTSRKGTHPPLRPLTAEYDFGWSGIKAAESTVRFTRAKGRNQLILSAATIGL